MNWQLLNKVVLGLILFTLVNVEQFYAQRHRVVKKRKHIIVQRRKLTLRKEQCQTPKTLSVISTQDDHMLLYDPDRTQCTQLVVYSWVGNRFQKRECELGPGKHWFYFRFFTPGVENIFKIFDANTQHEILPETTRVFLPKKPPAVAQAWPKQGFGQVWTYVLPPKESGTNLLGYRLSLLDPEKYHGWKVVGEFENVGYECSPPELKPVQNCPQWHTAGVYCTLFTDLVWWTESFHPTSNASNKFVKVETFRIPSEGCDRVYSDPHILPLFNITNETTTPSNDTTVASEPLNYSDWLWAIFLGLALGLLAVCIPALYVCAAFTGVGAAETLWQSIAGAEGNITVALGENMIVWENCPPWRCDRSA